ncbi:MAG: glycosyltransferase family 4 protein [Candidatus Sericytochromatia bacterium]|nr:glycosyltransferase family 4 protein [Candidatus Sericytochromatia bacterium]
MRIGLLAPLSLPVPPAAYGGTERVVGWLADGLVARGHEVVLFAAGDGATRATLRHRLAASLEGQGASRAAIDAAEAAHAAWALEEARGLDLVHDHLKAAGITAAAGARQPVLTTVHNAPTPARRALLERFPTHPLVALSEAHRHQLAGLRVVGTVPNGLDLEALPLATGPRDHLLFLGRLDAAKGADLAARLAAEADWPLVMAGRTQHDPRFFAEHVAPWLDGRRRRHVGEVGGRAKWELLASARALLFPIRWEEPFGLVMIEAMAVGTPVVATAWGAVPEVVAHRETGWIVPRDASLAALAEGVERVRGCPPEACRQHVARRFSAARMVDGYVALYEGLRAARAA